MDASNRSTQKAVAEVLADGCGILGMSFLAYCGHTHLCMCGHLQHEPRQFVDAVVDVGAFVFLLTSVVSALCSRMESKGIFYLFLALGVIFGGALPAPYSLPFVLPFIALCLIGLAEDPPPRWGKGVPRETQGQGRAPCAGADSFGL